MTGMEHAIEQVVDVLYAHRLGDPKGGTEGAAWCECSCGARLETWVGTRDYAVTLGRRHIARALAEAGLLAPAPLREEALADEPEPWRCPGCNSDRWIRASLTRGLTVITQCVPCGRYVNCPPPGRAEGDGRADQ